MSDTEPVAPALTAEEWIGFADEWPRLHRAIEEGDSISHVNGEPFTRHARAALCLYGQEFGFDLEDVELLRKPWHEDRCGAKFALYDEHACACDMHPDVIALHALAARIAALLPSAG